MPYKDSMLLDREPIECPICKKNFVPAPEHAWKIGVSKDFAINDDNSNRLVCSYTCMRVWEKHMGYDRKY